MLCRVGRHFPTLRNKLQQKQPGVCCSGDVRVARHQDSLRLTARSQTSVAPQLPSALLHLATLALSPQKSQAVEAEPTMAEGLGE